MAKKLLMSNSLTPPVDDRIFAEYTFDNTIDSNCLPTLTIVGGYEVIDEVNGNITRRILRNADKNKPTAISFKSKASLLTIERLIGKISTAQGLIGNCSRLTRVNLTGLDTTEVISMQGMASQCILLEFLDLSTFNTSKVINMNGAFDFCRLLTSELLISNLNITTYANIFGNTSTRGNAKFTVRYTDEATKAMAEKLVATKSSNSNVVLADSPGL